MTLARLMVLLHLDSAGFVRGLAQAQQQLAIFRQGMAGMGAGMNLQSIGRGLTVGLTIPLLAAATAIGVAGSQLTSEMARVQSVIATPGNMQSGVIAGWTDDVQALATTLGRTSPEVAGGLYEIVSAFGKLENTTEFLEIAGKAAVAGQSDIVQSTKNLALATRAWGDTSTGAVRQMADLAAQTVKVGTLTESELGPALAKMLPISKAYGVTLNDSFAALSALSGVTGNASEVATQFSRAVLSLVAPNAKLTAAYKAMGIESGALLIKQEGLQGALRMVADYADSTGVPLLKLLGRSEALKFSIGILGEQAETFADQSKALADAAGSVDTAFAGTTQGIDSAAFQWAQAMQRLRTIGEDLYIAFGPAVGNVAGSLAPIGKAFESMAQGVSQMDTDKLTIVVSVLLGLAALGPVISIIGSIATTLGALKAAAALLAGPVGLAAAAIAALAFALYLVKDDLIIRWNGLLLNIERRAVAVAEAVRKLREAWDALRTPEPTNQASDMQRAGEVLRQVGEVARAAVGPLRETRTEFQQASAAARQSVSAWSIFWGGFSDGFAQFRNMGRDLSALLNALVQSASQGFINLGTSIRSGLGLALGAAILSVAQFATAVGTGLNNAVSAAKSAASGIAAVFRLNWGSIGSSIASGIASGITSGASWIASAAKAAASSALSAAKAALGINSPSRVFQSQVGLMIPAGMAQGITSGAWMVSQALNRLVTPPTVAGAGGVSGLALVGAGGGSSSTSTITYGDINVYVTAGDGATGKEIGVSITQALKARGLI